MSTTGLVATITDELLAELEELAAGIEGWDMPHAFAIEDDDLLQEDWEWYVGQIDEDDNRYPVLNVSAHQYDPDSDDEKIARYYAACSRDKILSITQELRRLRADNAELEQALSESRANDRASMAWLSAYRVAAQGGDMPLPVMVAHIEGLAKDAGRLDYMIGEQCIMRVQNGTGSPLVYSLWWPTLGEGQISWHNSARDAIDTAMEEAQ